MNIHHKTWNLRNNCNYYTYKKTISRALNSCGVSRQSKLRCVMHYGLLYGYTLSDFCDTYQTKSLSNLTNFIRNT